MRRLSLSQAGEDTSPNQKNGIRAYCAVFAKTHLNFYRLHLFVFTILPLFASAIFYASNGPSPDNQIPFVDSMFMCYSAMTACGLATILFAQITVWQQVILFLLTAFGSLSSVSIVVILVRRHFFRKRFQHLVAHSPAVRQRVQAIALRSREASPEAEKGSRRTATNQRHVRFPGNQGYTFEQNPVLFGNSSTGCENTRPPQIAEADMGE